MGNFVRAIVVTISLLASCGRVHALATLKDEEAARAQADAAMEKVGKGDLEAALRDLGGSWPLPAAELETLVDKTKLQMPAMKGRFGEVIGQEFVKEYTVGSSFIRRIYLQRFERHAMRWVITHYRNNEGWVVNSVVFDDNLQGLFGAGS